MAKAPAQRRLAAILAADVVGYSRLMAADEAGTLAAVKSRRREVVDPLVARHQGRIFKTIGDGLLVEFASAVNAVECAVDLQGGMATTNRNRPEDHQIVLRIGINLGDIVAEDGDLYGDGVNVAARLEGIAEPGGITLSQAVFAQIQGKTRFDYDDLGEQHLKNLPAPVRVYRISGEYGNSRPEAMAATSSKPSIAVLPFNNLGEDKEQEYLSDGITEDVITELSRYRSLLVIARSSSFQFRGQSADVATIRQRLGVRYLVEGSLRKLGAQIRVSAQLIDSETEGTLWADRYDRRVDEIFDLQDQLASAIAATLEGRIVVRGAERARKKPTREWDAYDHFLQGRDLMHRYRSTEAETHFARAIAIDPGYLHAYAWRSMALTSSYVIESDRDPKLLASALAAAQHALSLDDQDAWGHQAMGYACLWLGRLDEAGTHYDRAVALNPNDIDIACDRANWLLCADRGEEALRALDSAMRRDPFPPVWAWEIRGSVLYHLERYEEALAAFRHVDADYYWMPAFMAASYAQLGRMEEARGALDDFLKLKPGTTVKTIDRCFFLYASVNWVGHIVAGLRKAGLPE